MKAEDSWKVDARAKQGKAPVVLRWTQRPPCVQWTAGCETACPVVW